MSRIHEALKKAAEERSSKLAAGSATDLVDVATDFGRAPLVEPAHAAPVRQDFRSDANPSQFGFEELVKNCVHLKWHPDPRTSVFHGADSKKVGAERFRTLRSRLYQIATAQQLKKVLVTSSIPAEGKTFVAANLANSIVRQNDRSVLLIDGDLRASRLHQALGAPSTPGLTDYLRGEPDGFPVIQKRSEGNLFFYPCGNPGFKPSELLLGERMKGLLDRVTPLFDWIILDSPPALPVHRSARMLASCTGSA